MVCLNSQWLHSHCLQGVQGRRCILLLQPVIWATILLSVDSILLWILAILEISYDLEARGGMAHIGALECIIRGMGRKIMVHKENVRLSFYDVL